MSSIEETDQGPLIETSRPRSRCLKPSILCPLLCCIGCLALLTSILINYVNYKVEDALTLRVMSMNTWGMPELFGAKDKEARVIAIGEMIAKKEYDLYLFEELWLRKDHETIRKHVPKNYTMTTYDSMTQKECPYIPLPMVCCDGSADPSGCSGLAIVSKYPIQDVKFTMYNDHGPMAGGEKLARKGFGRVRIEPKVNLTIDVFVTHTCASDSVDDKLARMSQVKQLTTAVRNSKADFVILGGDFNSDPRAKNETTYHMLKSSMASSMEDFFKKITDWLIPKKASYGNPRNSYSKMYEPVLYDYIWHRSSKDNLILTNFFDLPFLTTDVHVAALSAEEPTVNRTMTNKQSESTDKQSKVTAKRSVDTAERSTLTAKQSKRTIIQRISLSDHEPVSASLILIKGKN